MIDIKWVFFLPLLKKIRLSVNLHTVSGSDARRRKRLALAAFTENSRALTKPQLS